VISERIKETGKRVDWIIKLNGLIAPVKFASVKQKTRQVSPRWNGIKRFHWAGEVNSADFFEIFNPG
jgi:hypothetical protein